MDCFKLQDDLGVGRFEKTTLKSIQIRWFSMNITWLCLKMRYPKIHWLILIFVFQWPSLEVHGDTVYPIFRHIIPR